MANLPTKKLGINFHYSDASNELSEIYERVLMPIAMHCAGRWCDSVKTQKYRTLTKPDVMNLAMQQEFVISKISLNYVSPNQTVGHKKFSKYL